MLVYKVMTPKHWSYFMYRSYWQQRSSRQSNFVKMVSVNTWFIELILTYWFTWCLLWTGRVATNIGNVGNWIVYKHWLSLTWTLSFAADSTRGRWWLVGLDRLSHELILIASMSNLDGICLIFNWLDHQLVRCWYDNCF